MVLVVVSFVSFVTIDIVQAVEGTLAIQASSATISGTVTISGKARPAAGPVRFEYKSDTNSYATGIFLQDTTGRVGIGTQTPSQQLDVNGTLKATALSGDGTALTNLDIVPTGSIWFFNLTSCPSGWSEATAGRGRALVGLPSAGTLAGTAGSALTNLGTRTVTSVASHTHAVDPASTTTSADAHTHAVDPLSDTATLAGSHQHTFSTYDTLGNAGNARAAGTTTTIGSATTSSSGAHTHTLDVASFTSGSGGAAATHTVDVPSFNSGSTGSASVDVTMPFIQYVVCEKT